MKHLFTLGLAALIVLLGASLGASPARPAVHPETPAAAEAVDLVHPAPPTPEQVQAMVDAKPPGHCGQ